MIIILTFKTLHVKFALGAKVNRRQMEQQKGEIILS